MTVPAGAAAVEQTSFGTRDAADLVASFDGLGEGFEGPQGTATLRNPSDNSIAVGLNHIVVTVNSRMAIDPSDDCTIWYVGDYVRRGATAYSTRIAAFRMPRCEGR